MNNKIIWKDIDSTTIKGLIISELPPITKPRMRVQETQIDGVDGSIIEELGYESYDKSIIIGLAKDFDIDEVIKYFSGEGNVVFSNEPDKYYKAKIIEQIDYERLLRFRSATVTFRVQPFKYEYQEKITTLVEKQITGTEIYIKDASVIKIDTDVEGEIEIKNTGKNLINLYHLYEVGKSVTANGITFTINEDGSVTANGTSTSNSYIYLYTTANPLHLKAGTYRLSGENSKYPEVAIRGSYLNSDNAQAYVGSSREFKITGEVDLIIYVAILSGNTLDNLKFYPMLEKGEKATEYEMYQEQLITLPLPEGQVLQLPKGVNNISNSEDANMIVTYVDDKLIVENNGNYIAKPIMTIKGFGTIEFRLNDNTLFSYTFPDGEDTVVIDSQKQDAYLGSTLKNRNMSGEFPIFEIGENIITWEGTISNIEISSKSRWL